MSEGWKQTLKRLLPVFLLVCVWQIVVIGVIAYAVIKVHQPASQGLLPPSLLLKGLVNSDSTYYVTLATQGYQSKYLAVFYPVYPLVLRGLASLGISVYGAAFLVNFTSVLAASSFLYLLAREHFANIQGNVDRAALNAVLVFLFFPTAYFLSGIYTEVLFCALAFGAFYFARRRVWLLSALLVGIAGAVRVLGLVLMIAILFEYCSSIGWNWRRLNRKFLYFAFMPAGFLLYVYFLSRRFQDPFAFRNAYKIAWTYQVFEPNLLKTIWLQLRKAIELFLNRTAGGVFGQYESLADHILFLLSWFFGVAFLAYGRLKKLPGSYLLYMGLSLILYVLNSNVVSANRYLLPLFPIYLLISSYFINSKRESWLGLYLGCSALVMGLLATLFANGFWTG